MAFGESEKSQTYYATGRNISDERYSRSRFVILLDRNMSWSRWDEAERI